MTRGTTPTLRFHFCEDIGVFRASKIIVSFSQNGEILFDKDIDIEKDVKENIVTLTLTQEETLAMKVGAYVQYQIRLLINEQAYATPIYKSVVLDVIKDGKIGDEGIQGNLHSTEDIDIANSKRANATVCCECNEICVTVGEVSQIRGLDGKDGKDGQDGKDGITPHIGEDGYWYFGEDKTDYKAVGQDGKDGKDGRDGLNGENGIDGFSPTIEEVTNTEFDYTLKITDKNGSYTTPNLKGNLKELNDKVKEKISSSEKGIPSGVATLDDTGRVPSTQLPSYVDDVLEFDNRAVFPEQGEDGKIYIAKDTNLQYRWGGSEYVEISSSLALGETAQTAYSGDKGKKNADDIAQAKQNISAITAIYRFTESSVSSSFSGTTELYKTDLIGNGSPREGDSVLFPDNKSNVMFIGTVSHVNDETYTIDKITYINDSLKASGDWVMGVTANFPEMYNYNGGTWLCLTRDITTAPEKGKEWFCISEPASVVSVNGLTGEVEITAETLSLSTVATSGDYNDLSNTPDLSEVGKVKSVNGKTGDVNITAEDLGLANVATSGDYSDLSGTPAIPDVPAWALEEEKPTYTKEEVGLGLVDNVRQYSTENEPPYPVTSVNKKTGAVVISADDLSLSEVAKTGLYSDIIDTPQLGLLSSKDTITNADISLTANIEQSKIKGLETALASKANTEDLADIATSGSYLDLKNAPSFALVATSGKYTDLIEKPDIPTYTEATQVLSGLMSATDKKRLDDIYLLVGEETDDADEFVNTIREVLKTFENFPEGSNIASLLASKADKTALALKADKSDIKVTSVASRTGDVVLTKADVGLSLVDNVKQYSAENEPPYPVTSVQGRTGKVMITADDLSLGAVATSNSYNDLDDLPDLTSLCKVKSVNGKTGEVTITAEDLPLATVATSGAYSDLSGTPSIPYVYDWALSETKPSYTKAEVGLGNVQNVDTTNASNITSGTLARARLSSDVIASLEKAETALQSAPVTSVNGETGAVTIDIPTKLPNPQVLTISNGEETVTYDGTTAQTVNISAGGGVDYYDTVIRTQEEFDAWASNPNGESVLIYTGEYRLKNSVVLSTVKRICGIGNVLLILPTPNSYFGYSNVGNVGSVANPSTKNTEYYIKNITFRYGRITAFINVINCKANGASFVGCYNLLNCYVTGQDTGSDVVDGLFYNCTNLTNCVYNADVTGLYAYLVGFSKCKNITNCVVNASSVQNVKETEHSDVRAFKDCTRLQNCFASIQNIHNNTDYTLYAFDRCTEMTNCHGYVSDPKGSKAYVFRDCSICSNCVAESDGHLTAAWTGINTYINKDTCPEYEG